MLFKKNKHINSSDALILLKYVLLSLLIILLPLTLFLTGFSWYASLQVHKLNNSDLPNYGIFWKNCLIFGVIGLMSFLIYFLLFLLMNYGLKHVSYKWKKIILISAIFIVTIIFCIFEIFSVIFIDYYYSWQLILALVFWPLVYIMLTIFLLITYFKFSDEQKKLNSEKSINSYDANNKHNKEKDFLLKEHQELTF